MQDRAGIFRETSLLYLKKGFGVFITYSKGEMLLRAGIKGTATNFLHLQKPQFTNSTWKQRSNNNDVWKPLEILIRTGNRGLKRLEKQQFCGPIHKNDEQPFKFSPP